LNWPLEAPPTEISSMPWRVCAPAPPTLFTRTFAVPTVSPSMTSLSVAALSSASTVLNTIVPSLPMKSPATVRVLNVLPSPSDTVPLPRSRRPREESPFMTQVDASSARLLTLLIAPVRRAWFCRRT